MPKRKPVGCIYNCVLAWDGPVPARLPGCPLVHLEHPRGRNCGRLVNVFNDGAAVARMAFRELASTRPDSYAVVCLPDRRFWESIRVQTFRTLAHDAKLPCRVFARHNESLSARASRLVAWLRDLPPKCAVFAVNDAVACEVMTASICAGKRIPGDLVLIGVDDIASAGKTDALDLSSACIDFEMAGYRAATLLAGRIDGTVAPGTFDTYGPLMVIRRASTRANGRHDAQVYKAVERIRREACSGLRARDVAAGFTCSRRLVEMRFRETLGHSILDEIENVRMARVLQLLQDRKFPLELIFVRSGYPSAEALRKQFRLRHGMSLSDWRKANARH